MAVSKEQFIACIKAIQKINDYKDDIYELTRKYNYLDYTPDFPSVENELVCLLDSIFSPVSQDISYFCYELDFGRKYEEGCITDDDGPIDFSSAEKLYEYLVSPKNLKENNISDVDSILEKQEAKTPVLKDTDIKYYSCPSCGHMVGSDNEITTFYHKICQQCGQVINWGGILDLE